MSQISTAIAVLAEIVVSDALLLVRFNHAIDRVIGKPKDAIRKR